MNSGPLVMVLGNFTLPLRGVMSPALGGPFFFTGELMMALSTSSRNWKNKKQHGKSYKPRGRMAIDTFEPRHITRARPNVTVAAMEEFLERMSHGETLSKITNDPRMPPWLYIWQWLKDPKHTAFKAAFDLAQEAQLNRLASETLDIADDVSQDFIEYKDTKGKVYRRLPNQELVNRSRLRIDARHWLLSRKLAKEYGDSTMLKLSDHTGEGPATFSFTVEAAGGKKVKPKQLDSGNVYDADPDAD